MLNEETKVVTILKMLASMSKLCDCKNNFISLYPQDDHLGILECNTCKSTWTVEI